MKKIPTGCLFVFFGLGSHLHFSRRRLDMTSRFSVIVFLTFLGLGCSKPETQVETERHDGMSLGTTGSCHNWQYSSAAADAKESEAQPDTEPQELTHFGPKPVYGRNVQLYKPRRRVIEDSYIWKPLRQELRIGAGSNSDSGSSGSTYVREYRRKDGTRVKGHRRNAPRK